MNIILMTILLTLLGAGLVVLLVWLSVVYWKSMRFNKDSIDNFLNIERKIDEDYNNLSTKIDKTTDDIYNKIDMTYTNLDDYKRVMHRDLEEVYKRIETEINDLHRGQFDEIWKKFTDLERINDSRFDKLHNLVSGCHTQIEILQQKEREQKERERVSQQQKS